MKKIDRRKIRAVMAIRDMSQNELIAKTGLSRVTVNGVCCGRSCSEKTMKKIAAALEVDFQDLLERSD